MKMSTFPSKANSLTRQLLNWDIDVAAIAVVLNTADNQCWAWAWDVVRIYRKAPHMPSWVGLVLGLVVKR